MMGTALVALTATLEMGRPAAWGRIGLSGALLSMALYGANQAVGRGVEPRHGASPGGCQR